jgi:uncharacterized protein YaiI (UPF0178 family)
MYHGGADFHKIFRPEVHRMQIWIDADACPKDVKDLVFRASARLSLPVCLVANRALALPPSPLIRQVRVRPGSDVADSYIVQHVEAADIVITADIPLAAQVVGRGAVAIDPRGELYTADTVGERLAMRNLMEELRWSGVVSGGPPAYSPADRRRFAEAFNRLLTRRQGS